MTWAGPGCGCRRLRPASRRRWLGNRLWCHSCLLLGLTLVYDAYAANPDVRAATIGGVTFTYAQLAAATALAPLVIDTPQGVLNITGFAGTNAGGTVSYSYTLQDPVANAAASNSATESLTVTVTDADGSVASDSFDVTIIDDAPVAVDDTVAIGEDAVSVGGNVLTNDNDGADDGATVTTPGTYVGTYGTLVLGANGAYTYTLRTDPATVAVIQGLSAGDTLTESFAYTMRDGDLDTSNANINVTINGANDIVTITGLGLRLAPDALCQLGIAPSLAIMA